MRAIGSWFALASLLLTAYSLHGGGVGFEVGNGVAITGGVVRVNFNLDKRRSFSLGAGPRVTIVEVQLTQASGRVYRHTMISMGKHTVRVPMPIELTEVLGLCSLLGLIGIIITMTYQRRPAEHGASPNGAPPKPLGDSGVVKGRPSVS